MCTVTFIGSIKGSFLLTSNRDEKVVRSTLAPAIYPVGKQNVAYPKDSIAGGTWIAMGKNGIVVCLLNGGFQLHESKESYRKSRGLIVLDVFRFSSISDFIRNSDLDGIEPFTLILFNAKSHELVELVWDEHEKHTKKLDATKNYFWSSATLYSPSIAAERKTMFMELIKRETKIEKGLIADLHRKTKEEGGFLLKRNDGIETVSITQLTLNGRIGNMTYQDLIKSELKLVHFPWQRVLR